MLERNLNALCTYEAAVTSDQAGVWFRGGGYHFDHKELAHFPHESAPRFRAHVRSHVQSSSGLTTPRHWPLNVPRAESPSPGSRTSNESAS